MEESAYNPRSEVRFAIVMYGGVSLAIYINGVAQELFRLVRATAPNNGKTNLAIPDGELSLLERIYREIGRRRTGGLADDWTELADPVKEFVGTRFVVDIVTGTSAGGINGILLAKALANGRPDIDGLKKLWIEEGQIDDLLNEPSAYDGIRDIRYSAPPTSLLAGDRLRIKAEDAISGMVEPIEDAPQYADELDLAVTMTDLQGLWQPLVLADGDVLEAQHRASLKFVYATKEASGEERNDFKGSLDRLLAFAARATSSFPFAFAPVQLRDVAPEPTSDEQEMFGDWANAKADFESFSFADGGYLQNKPITQATQALKRRRADQPVERKLLYVEPDPEPIPPSAKRNAARPRPDALANVGAAIVGLPRTQPIRDDIDALWERNQAVERVELLTREVVEDVLRGDEAVTSAESGRAYLGLRKREIVGDLTDLVARNAKPEPETAWSTAVYDAIWTHALADADVQDPVDYMRNLDLRFRLRRLTYVLERIDDLLRASNAATGLLEAILRDEPHGAVNDWFSELKTDEAKLALRRLKATVNDKYAALRGFGRKMRARSDQDGQAIETQAQALAAAVSGWKEAASQTAELRAFTAGIDRDVEVAAAADVFVKAVANELKDAFAEDDAVIESLTAAKLPPQLEKIVRLTFERAEAIDAAVFPAGWSTVGEARRVAIHRVSPRDAESLVPMPELGAGGKPEGRRRLAGVSLGHFGGFLDRKWRRNDMLWGRLDAAERLTSILVPETPGEGQQAREAFRIRAQAAILREEFRDPEAQDDLLDVIEPKKRDEFLRALVPGSNDTVLLDLFKSAYRGPSELESAKAMELLGRSAQVTGGVLTSVERGHRLLQKPAFWLTRLGRFIFGFAQVAAPPQGANPFGHAARFAPQIAILVAALLIAIGTVAGLDGAQSTGWILAGGTLVLMVVRWLFQGRPWFVPICVLIAGGIITLATLEVVHHFEDDISDGWEFAAGAVAVIALAGFTVSAVRRARR